MTEEQRMAVALTLRRLDPTEVHHGVCKGADEDFHEIVLNEFQQARPVIHLHPGVNGRGEAPTRGEARIPEDWDVRIHKELPYIRRDEVMVKVCGVLIATPKGFLEENRSGTWTTIRRARTFHKPHCIVYPSGRVARFDKQGIPET
jgi:hypothetical protein